MVLSFFTVPSNPPPMDFAVSALVRAVESRRELTVLGLVYVEDDAEFCSGYLERALPEALNALCGSGLAAGGREQRSGHRKEENACEQTDL
jgi:hypothetical protein